MYFELALAAMLCELVSEYRKYDINDGRMMAKLDKALYGCIESAIDILSQLSFGISISRVLWRS